MKKHLLMLASWSMLFFGTLSFASCDDDDDETPAVTNNDKGSKSDDKGDESEKKDNESEKKEDSSDNKNDDSSNDVLSASEIFNKYKNQKTAAVVGDDVYTAITIEGETTVIVINYKGDNLVGGKSYTDLKTEALAKKALAEALEDGEKASVEGSILVTEMDSEDIEDFSEMTKDEFVMAINYGLLEKLLSGDLFGDLFGEE